MSRIPEFDKDYKLVRMYHCNYCGYSANMEDTVYKHITEKHADVLL